MTQRRTIEISPETRQALIELRDATKYEYIRERCAAILKIADGTSAHQVAKTGLLRPRDPDTVYGWLDLLESEGIAGLKAHRQGGPRRGYL